MTRETVISGLLHDVAEAGGGIAIVAGTLHFGAPSWLAALLASPMVPIGKLVMHRLKYRETPWRTHLQDLVWESLVWGAGWWMLIGVWYLTLPALLGWWGLLTWIRHRTKWGNP